MRAVLSILGMYNYQPDIFDDLNLDPVLEPQRQDIIDSILASCANLGLVYTSPGEMKKQIRLWSIRHEYSWKTLYQTTVLSYNPIENYNRIEELQTKVQYGKTESGTLNQSQKYDETSTDGGTANSTESVSAYTADTLKDKTKLTSTNNVTSTHKTNGDGNTMAGTNEIRHTGTDTTTTNNNLHGNIGVTSTQDMIIQEREIAMYSFMDAVVGSFKRAFCVMVY